MFKYRCELLSPVVSQNTVRLLIKNSDICGNVNVTHRNQA